MPGAFDASPRESALYAVNAVLELPALTPTTKAASRAFSACSAPAAKVFITVKADSSATVMAPATRVMRGLASQRAGTA